MGKGLEETTRKKKKGRPSLLDIQKRILKQQSLQETAAENPNSGDPDGSSNPSQRSGIYRPSEWVSGADEEDNDEERFKKKQKLLFRLDSKGEKVLRGTDTGGRGSVDVSGPTTPLPNKKLLAFILDRVQKKDTHGVFSEPVDPEELPDYHDIIKHPMDFGTVRKKLEGDAYANLEEFEKDVLLICSNAMQYNSPDTVFFRQARSMQEIAKKDFQNLREESDDSEPEQTKNLRRGRPPGRGLKKLQEKSSADRPDPEASSELVLANGDNSCSPNAYNLRKGPPDSFHLQHADSIGNASSRVNRESQSGWFTEFDKEFPASVLRSVMKEGKKLCPADENKRDSYKQQTTGKGQSIFGAFESEKKYLTVVALQSQDHGYARSIARFASNLGPVVWKIASKKIKSIIPEGTKFGPGWVGEDEVLGQSRFPLPQRQNTHPPCDRLLGVSSSVGLNSSLGDSESAKILASQTSLTSPSNITADIKSMNGASINRFGGGEEMATFPVSSEASLPPDAPGMVSSGYGTIQGTLANHIYSTNDSSQRFSRLPPCNSFRADATSSEELPWNLQAQPIELNPDHAQVPPDWNARFPVQASSSSSLLISSQQPNLGLQL